MKKTSRKSNYPSNRLQTLRVNAELSQRDLAEMAGVSASLINQLEAGLRPFTKESIQRLSRVLSVRDEVLLGTSNYGVYIQDRNEEFPFQELSFEEYMRQIKLGNIKEEKTQFQVPTYYTGGDGKVTNSETMHYAGVARRYSYPEASMEFLNKTKEEIFSAVSTMSQSQLDSLLVIVKEVISKIK